jgi:diketogulonate reductase-like aldo/keto reductase
MEIPVKRLNSGFGIPVFGLGTWKMGGKMERDPSNNGDILPRLKVCGLPRWLRLVVMMPPV